MKRLRYIGIGLLVFCSCNKSPQQFLTLEAKSSEEFTLASDEMLSASDYLNWFEESGGKLLMQEKTIGEMNYGLLYKPSVYEALKTESDPAVSDELIYYTLRLSTKSTKEDLLKYGISNPTEYQDRVSYYSFDVMKDISLIYGKDTLPCAGVVFERTFNVGPFITMMVNFIKPEHVVNSDTLYNQTFIFEDHIFEGGRLQFQYTSQLLSQIPKLKK